MTTPKRKFDDHDSYALVEHLFRQQSGQLTATLCRILGQRHIDLAEEITQETMLAALRRWSIYGAPLNPVGWLFTVARNKALDKIRQLATAKNLEQMVAAKLYSLTPTDGHDSIGFRRELTDDMLQLIFACCHPALSRASQVALTLKTACGFSVREISRAFLVDEESIFQRLSRAKRTLRDLGALVEIPCDAKIESRIDATLETIYFLFNEGYHATTGEKLFREELCAEALRLVEILSEHPLTDVPQTHALAALIALQSARLPARLGPAQEIVLLDRQDRSLWDKTLIQIGLAHLTKATSGSQLSEFHLLAGISSCHAIADNFESTNWERIVYLYDQLLAINPSPIIVLNRAVAVAAARGAAAGLLEIDAISHESGLDSYSPYFAAKGYLLQKNSRTAEAAIAFRQAAELTTNETERRFLLEQV